MSVSPEDVEAALQEARRQLVSGDSLFAQSVCLDVLEAHPGHVDAVVLLVEAIAESWGSLTVGAARPEAYLAQVNDPAWYRNEAERDRAVAALPTLALAPRAGFVVPDEHTLPIDPFLLDVSSSAVRAGRTEWMTEPARLHHDRHGTWG